MYLVHAVYRMNILHSMNIQFKLLSWDAKKKVFILSTDECKN